MFTKKHRPQSFAEMKGASLPRAVLQAMARKAPNIPQSVILCGGYGTGKTTSARILARALNCERKNGDACNKCQTCQSIVDGSPLYAELDSAVVGSVEIMRGLRDSFGYSIQKGMRVVVFDECQVISKAAQSALLNVLEEAPPGVVFVFATTDPEALLEPIRSRSIEIQFELHSDKDITELVMDIATQEKVTVSAETCQYIVRRVNGHARDAVQAVELIGLIGEEDYRKTAVVLDKIFQGIVTSFGNGANEDAGALIREVIKHPVLHIATDFGLFVNSISEKIFIKGVVGPKNKQLRQLIFFYLKYHRLLNSSNEWYIFLCALGSLFEEKSTGVSAANNPFAKKPS